MSIKLGMVIEASSCIDCKGCLAACKVANLVPEGFWRNWIKGPEDEAGARRGGRVVFQPGGCMHCDQPTCVAACPTGATSKDPADGTVGIDRGLCIGCGQCLPACPYSARYRHPELKVADKCDFCAERRAAGLQPACVDTCPTKARTFGDLNDPESEAAKKLASGEVLQVVHPRSQTDPNLYYLGRPGPTDWPREARLPTAWQTWKRLANPAVKGFFGLTALGVLAMLGKQLLMPQDRPLEPPEQEDGEKGGRDE